jgi:hypothetical protein
MTASTKVKAVVPYDCSKNHPLVDYPGPRACQARACPYLKYLGHGAWNCKHWTKEGEK